MDLDEIDKKIISQLQVDGRTTLEELAKITGFTSMGTKKRLEKLTKSGAIKVSALINPTALELHTAIVLLEMESAEAMQTLIERFIDCPRVINIFKTMGGYNLFALVVAENQDMLECIAVERCSLRNSPGIRRSEFYLINDICYSPFLQIREFLFNKEKTAKHCGVDCNSCGRFEAKKCSGCPTTVNLRVTP